MSDNTGTRPGGRLIYFIYNALKESVSLHHNLGIFSKYDARTLFDLIPFPLIIKGHAQTSVDSRIKNGSPTKVRDRKHSQRAFCHNLNKKKGVCLAFHHPIHIPLGSMYPLAQLGQDAAQAVGRHAPHG